MVFFFLRWDKIKNRCGPRGRTCATQKKALDEMKTSCGKGDASSCKDYKDQIEAYDATCTTPPKKDEKKK